MARTKTITDANETASETKVLTEKPQRIDGDYFVPVKSNVKGELIYTSKDDSYREIWYGYGEVIEMEMRELIKLRNSHKGWFQNNWIVLEGTDEYSAQDFYRSLNVAQFYPKSEKISSMEDIFDMNANEITEFVTTLSDGYKESIASFARQLIKEEDKRLDAKSKVKALEKALGRTLTDED